MSAPLRRILTAALCCVAVGACQSNARAEGEAETSEPRMSTQFDRSHFAGDVAFRMPVSLPTTAAPLPFEVYLGLAPETQTRMGLRTLLDLRDVQAQLPDRLSGVVEDSCKRHITLDFQEATAEGGKLRAKGAVQIRLIRCRNEGTDAEAQGATWLTQDVDAEATASLSVKDDCLAVSLEEVTLSPRGFVGGLANFFGVTSLAQTAVTQKGAETLAEHPVCPDLPSDLATLSPSFAEASVVEIDDGGIGAAMVGSVDTSAETLLVLIAKMQDEGLLEASE